MEQKNGKKKLLKKIQQEYVIFKYKMLSGNRKEIYDSSNQIIFYECLHEYFLYYEEISESFIEVTKDMDNILERLYVLYLKYEHLQVYTWDNINELIMDYVCSVS